MDKKLWILQAFAAGIILAGQTSCTVDVDEYYVHQDINEDGIIDIVDEQTFTNTPATRSEQAPRIIKVSANGGIYGVSITANGNWVFPGALGGNENASDQFWTYDNLNNEGSRGGSVTITIPVNTTGAERTFTRTVTNGQTPPTVIGGITVTQEANYGVKSSDVSSIVTRTSSQGAPSAGTSGDIITIVIP